MSQTIKVLGQVNPSAASLTDAYVSPTSSVISSIIVCNRSVVATAFRISIAIGGAADDNKQYIAYDALITGNQIIPFVNGITLGPTDVIRVYATLATLTFNIFGVQQQ